MGLLEPLITRFWLRNCVSLYFVICVQVPSEFESRFVGYEDPLCHQVRWFELQLGHPHYIADIGLYFQLKHVPDTLPMNKTVSDWEKVLH
jgi:hypothetical protein